MVRLVNGPIGQTALCPVTMAHHLELGIVTAPSLSMVVSTAPGKHWRQLSATLHHVQVSESFSLLVYMFGQGFTRN